MVQAQRKSAPPDEPRRNVNVRLPDFHKDQERAEREMTRYFAMRCGRRWGKSTFAEIYAAKNAIKSRLVGYFAPDYKRLTEIIVETADILKPIRVFPSGGKDIIRCVTGGRVDFWTLEDPNAGRSRKYHRIIIDEAAFAKPNMMDIWEKNLKPTLIDYGGSAMVCSNTNGAIPDQFFWRICNESKHEFVEFKAPSHNNPLLPRDDLEKWAKTMHPLVYQQEILAEFVDWSGVAFFALPSLLGANGKGIDPPLHLDNVFAIIDTAMKTGKENDGTGVIFFGTTSIFDPPLIILDWDLLQIEGALLEKWLPSVYTRLEFLAKKFKARHGSLGALIEDKGSGTVLLQQAIRRGWQAREIPETLTALGKDERALNVSGHVHVGKVKLSKDAYDKTVNYKEAERNHLVTQVTGFRVGDKDAAKRADDLLDCFTYGIAVSLGNSEGF